jgi:aspartate ammonia-lyase
MEQVYWSEQTAKALANFGSSPQEPDFIRALGEVKKAALLAIQDFYPYFDKTLFSIIINVLDDIIAGCYNGQFPVPFKQGSAGTSLNMNMNEVIAGITKAHYQQLTGQSINLDPIQEINRFQSTNDIIPTAVTVMAYRHLTEIEKQIINLQETLIKKENEYGTVVMTGRTEMQAALPITLGQVFGGWAGCIERDRWRLFKLKERIRNIALGGTALGTCFSAPSKYVFNAERHLREITGLPLCRSQNLVDEISNLDKLAELANGYSLCAQNLVKISQDFLLYTSSMVDEITHPALQYGSTIMAAKNNPVILEFVKGLAINIQGEAFKINCYMQQGQLQLNALLPFVLECLITMYHDLEKALTAFKEQFLDKIVINYKNIEKNLVNSDALLNTLLPSLGYHKIKELYAMLQAQKGCGQACDNLDDLKAFLVKHTSLSQEEITTLFDPLTLTSNRRSVYEYTPG